MHYFRIGVLFALVFVPGMASSWAMGGAEFPDESASMAAARAQTEANEPTPRPRQYAPDRQADILNLTLDVTPDFDQRTISGKAIIRFQPIAKPLAELKLDAVELRVREVHSAAPIQTFHSNHDSLVVTFARAIPADQEATVEVEYSAQPEKGLYFRTPEMGYGAQETQVFSQGEAIEARHWYPCYDYPNEKFSSEIICHVPEGMVALSNGKLISQEKDPRTGLVAFHWKSGKPHVNYLISLVAGYFKKVQDQYRGIPMAFYVSPSDVGEAPNSFRETKEAMAFFEKEIGVPYPWEKYDQVAVKDFMFGGMENVSITTLTDRTLFTGASENIRTSEGLVSHELAHQWFGDLVTCKDWSQIWLNESFATFYAHLFDEHQNGLDSMRYSFWQTAEILTGGAIDTRPVVYRKYAEPEDLFRQLNHLVYGKGSWVLRMLRHELGADLYRRCIRTYLERRQFNTAVTEDLLEVVEELSGRSFDRFFDQWIFHGGVPELHVQYEWDQTTKLAKISVAQTQKVTDDVFLFQFPLELRFKGKFGITNQQVQVTGSAEDFYVPLPEAPDEVRIDPELALLAKAQFQPPTPMLLAQIEDDSDGIGRILAIRELAKKADHESIQRIERRLQKDPFYGVRIEASKALAQIHSSEAFRALAASKQQADARVRLQVTADLGNFYSKEAFDLEQEIVRKEKNPEILARAIPLLAGYAQADVQPQLLAWLKSVSYKNQLVDAAIRGMRAQDDPVFTESLLEALKSRRAECTSETLAQGLETLGHLGRQQEKKDSIRSFLLEQTEDKRRMVKIGALNGLGALHDLKAVPILEKFASGRKNTPEQTAAERALSEVRSVETPSEAVAELRKEMVDLRKQNQQLRKEFDEFKKKTEAASERATEARKPNRSKEVFRE